MGRLKKLFVHMGRCVVTSIEVTGRACLLGLLYASFIVCLTLCVAASVLLLFINTGGYSAWEVFSTIWISGLLFWSMCASIVGLALTGLWIHYMIQTLLLRKRWVDLNIYKEWDKE